MKQWEVLLLLVGEVLGKELEEEVLEDNYAVGWTGDWCSGGHC